MVLITKAQVRWLDKMRATCCPHFLLRLFEIVSSDSKGVMNTFAVNVQDFGRGVYRMRAIVLPPAHHRTPWRVRWHVPPTRTEDQPLLAILLHLRGKRLFLVCARWHKNCPQLQMIETDRTYRAVISIATVSAITVPRIRMSQTRSGHPNRSDLASKFNCGAWII